MKKALTAIAFMSVTLALPGAGQASDHADGLKTALDMTADISDLYAFMSPSAPGKLVVIMNVHPFAIPMSRFSDHVSYNFRFRPIDGVKSLQPSPGGEHMISCTFKGGSTFDSTQDATCAFDQGQSVSFRTNDENAPESNGMKAFAGRRADTWFLSIPQVQRVNSGKKPEGGKSHNSLAGMSVMSIVVEVDAKKVGGPLVAITTETVRRK